MKTEYETYQEAFDAAHAISKRLAANLGDADALSELREFGLTGNSLIADLVSDRLPAGWYEDARSGNGSLYVTYEAVTGEDVDGDAIYRTVKVRYADHDECYCSEDISCDPAGITPAQVIEHLRGIHCE